MSLPERAGQMLHRLAGAARRAGAGERGGLVVAAAELAIAARSRALDERDPALLHPARSALVLLEDVRERDPVIAAAASLVESLDTGLEVPPDRIRAGLNERATAPGEATAAKGDVGSANGGAAAAKGDAGSANGVPVSAPRAELVPMGDDVVALVLSVPTPAREGDRLLESLLAADRPARLAALAERLDHARHLHLRGSEWWAAFHESAVAVYLPVARRTDPVLTGRLEWWVDMFARRYLPRA